MALAVSTDGVDWKKPDLGQGIEVRGSKRNNRIQVDSTEGVLPPPFENTVHDADDPNPSRRFKGLLGAINRVPIVSSDAVRWDRLDALPIASNDESSLTYDRSRRPLSGPPQDFEQVRSGPQSVDQRRLPALVAAALLLRRRR